MNAAVELMLTADGSHTAVNQTLGTAYHSVHGAIQESERVFIELGLLAAFDRFPNQEWHVFEMGFGTGLNALLTLRQAEANQRRVHYTAVEAYPMPLEAAQQLNYDSLLGTNSLTAMHQAPWNQLVPISSFFSLTKMAGDLADFDTDERFHLIYYDAFAPAAQPELWEAPVFEKLAQLLYSGGILTTYCSKGYVQRNLRAAGLVVEKHPGPARKREVLRAVKP